MLTVTEAEEFIEKANESLMLEFQHLPFHQVDNAIRTSYINLGEERANLKHLMLAYCEIQIQNETSFTENAPAEGWLADVCM